MTETKTPYLISWIDSSGLEGPWVPIADAQALVEPEHPLCETLGWILEESDAWLVVFSSAASSTEQVGGVVAIPKVCIKSMVALGAPVAKPTTDVGGECLKCSWLGGKIYKECAECSQIHQDAL